MGNKTPKRVRSDTEELRYRKQFGVINFNHNKKESDQIAYYIDIESDSETEFDNLKSYWSNMVALKSYFVSPMKIEVLKESGLFNRKYGLRVWLIIPDYTLTDFSTQNMQLNPLIPEIQILNIVSNITDALIHFDKIGIKHGNVSSDTINFDGVNWLLSTPHIEYVSLEIRKTQVKETLQFLIAPELLLSNIKASAEQSKADLYSLGVTLVHLIDRFQNNLLGTTLSEKDFRGKIGFIDQYYSKTLVDIFTRILVLDPSQRISAVELRAKLDLMIDVSPENSL